MRKVTLKQVLSVVDLISRTDAPVSKNIEIPYQISRMIPEVSLLREDGIRLSTMDWLYRLSPEQIQTLIRAINNCVKDEHGYFLVCR